MRLEKEEQTAVWCVALLAATAFVLTWLLL